MRYNNASEMVQSNSIHGIQNGFYSECSSIELPWNNDGNKTMFTNSETNKQKAPKLMFAKCFLFLGHHAELFI